LDTIFTTKGFLPADQVEMRPTVTCDDDDKTVTRVDKYLKETGEWVGNDLHVHMKRLPAIFGEQGAFA